MGAMSIWHWVIVIAVIALLFGGRGKLSGLMGDAAKGIKAFKDGLKDDDTTTGSGASGAALPQADSQKDEQPR